MLVFEIFTTWSSRLLFNDQSYCTKFKIELKEIVFNDFKILLTKIYNLYLFKNVPHDFERRSNGKIQYFRNGYQM